MPIIGRMNLSLSKRKQQATGSKRSVLLSEEELSDRRSNSSTDSRVKQRKVNDTRCQRLTRKAKNMWKGSHSFLDCQFSGSSNDEDWNRKSSTAESSDSDPAWSPTENNVFTNGNKCTKHLLPPTLEPNLVTTVVNEDPDSESSSTPPVLTEIITRPTRSSRKSSQNNREGFVYENATQERTATKLIQNVKKAKKSNKKSSLSRSPKAKPVVTEEGQMPTPSTPSKPTVSIKSNRSSPLPPHHSLTDNAKAISVIAEERNSIIKCSLDEPDESTECRLTFFGITSYKANLLDKGFDSGKFIMLKSDLKTQQAPCIWRIDGKNLLQKYEPISYNDGVAYRNISTYSSWMATNKGLYVPIEIEYVIQSKSETIVTFDRTKVMLPIEEEIMEAVNDEANGMVDTFQIYLQTLLSQALDSNFLKEIAKENDEYFLTSVAAVEDHWILPKRQSLKEIIKMKKGFQELLEAHPGLELRSVTSGDKSCDTCGGRNPTRSFEFLTLTYDFDTLDIMEGKPSNKIYRLCLSCTDRVLLYHELFHMRYNLFLCCQAKVQHYDQGDGPAALTSSLADQSWKSFMHRQVLLVLAETQQVVSQHSASACIV